MKRAILLVFLMLGSLAAVGQDAIKPSAYWWARISSARQLGYVEGFNAGSFTEMETSGICASRAGKPSSANPNAPICILYRWRQATREDADVNATLEAVSKFYADPRNAPIKWSEAVLIAEAMVSGVTIRETDLEIIRQAGAGK
jgi:hypothetical protein